MHCSVVSDKRESINVGWWCIRKYVISALQCGVGSEGEHQRWVVVYQEVCDKCIAVWCRIGGRASTLGGGVSGSM